MGDRHALLSVRNLTLSYRTAEGDVRALDDVSLELDRGRTLGIVGESGCGKTSLTNAILSLLPENARLESGGVFLDGVDLTRLAEEQLRRLRWERISVVFQNAMSALDPVFRVGDLLEKILLLHRRLGRREARARIREVFDLVRLPPEALSSYPHQLSGGMKQRVSIAASLVCDPEIVILDEPTTALDILLQDNILQEIEDLRSKLGIAIIIVSHDISVIAELSDVVVVMYAGKVFEVGDSETIFGSPGNPYTLLLINSFPQLTGPKRELVGISGSPPGLLHPPPGCRFHPRCPFREDICRRLEPPWTELSPGHYSLCHFREVNLDRLRAAR